MAGHPERHFENHGWVDNLYILCIFVFTFDVLLPDVKQVF